MNPSMLPQTGPSEVRHPDEVLAVTKRILRRSPARGRHILERLEGVRAIAVDRPGFGLSDPAGVPRERFRTGAVEFLEEVLDELELETAVLAGNSMGGTWALWYALARPARLRGLVLLGAAPLLPGTRVPPPLRDRCAAGLACCPPAHAPCRDRAGGHRHHRQACEAEHGDADRDAASPAGSADGSGQRGRARAGQHR